LQTWLGQVKASKVTAANNWDRVRLNLPDGQPTRLFDMIAHFNKDNPNNYETLLALYDHTQKYQSEDNNTSYVALAVHELRTPLTLLRGYIEVFEDELGSNLTPELKDFMTKMSAAAQTLTAFVSNILNVARVDENQLTLSLAEANWNELLPSICKDLEIRAKVRGKQLQLNVMPNLPTVAVDKISIYEVLSNLIDNAIKYSDKADKVIVHARIASDGNVETIVQDFGLGIPESAVKNLFTKFYRSHRSRGAVSGSGLGLYLVKAIVNAHGGNVWVQSKEGEGSSFGFTLQPFKNLANGESGQGGLERQAHGWIKNHSMYRR
jgi:signal transduction histidine kinase